MEERLRGQLLTGEVEVRRIWFEESSQKLREPELNTQTLSEEPKIIRQNINAEESVFVCEKPATGGSGAAQAVVRPVCERGGAAWTTVERLQLLHNVTFPQVFEV